MWTSSWSKGMLCFSLWMSYSGVGLQVFYSSGNSVTQMWFESFWLVVTQVCQTTIRADVCQHFIEVCLQ